MSVSRKAHEVYCAGPVMEPIAARSASPRRLLAHLFEPHLRDAVLTTMLAGVTAWSARRSGLPGDLVGQAKPASLASVENQRSSARSPNQG